MAEGVVRRFVLSSSATAVRSARTELAGSLRATGVDGGVIDDAVVVLSELVTNAVRHGVPDPSGGVRVEWQLEAPWLRLQVTDRGRAERRMNDKGAVGGRGLSIVAAIADSWTLEPAPQGTTVTAFLRVS